MIYLWLSLLAGGLLPATQFSGRDASVPTVEQVLAKCRAARGGDPAAGKVSSFHMAGSLEIPNAGVTGSAEVFAKAPNKLLVRWAIPGFGAVRSGYNGRTGWFETLLGGLTQVEGNLLESMRLRSEMMQVFNLSGPFSGLTLHGRKAAGVREFWVVRARSVGAGLERWYFDIESGLLSRVDGVGDDGLPLEVDLEDYHEIDGLKYPFTIRHFTPVYSAVMRFHSVRTNVALDDAFFDRPRD